MERARNIRAIALGLTLGFLSSGTMFAAGENQSTPTERPVKPVELDISIGSERMSGDTTYSTGDL